MHIHLPGDDGSESERVIRLGCSSYEGGVMLAYIHLLVPEEHSYIAESNGLSPWNRPCAWSVVPQKLYPCAFSAAILGVRGILPENPPGTSITLLVLGACVQIGELGHFCEFDRPSVA